jgi:hypothetical protein
MRKEIEEWNEWLRVNKNIDVNDLYNEYILETGKTVEDLLEFLATTTNTTVFDLKNGKNFRRRKSNYLVRCRGLLVKAILTLNIDKKINSKNIYSIVFGFYRDHSTALHFKNDYYVQPDEEKVYEQIENYLKTYKIEWQI